MGFILVLFSTYGWEHGGTEAVCHLPTASQYSSQDVQPAPHPETVLDCPPGARVQTWLSLCGALHFNPPSHSCLLLCKYCFRTGCLLKPLTISDRVVCYLTLQKWWHGGRKRQVPWENYYIWELHLKVTSVDYLILKSKAPCMSQFLWFVSLEASGLFYGHFHPRYSI